MEIREDRWLAAIFGYPVFRLEGELRSAGVTDLIGDHARRQAAAMYWAKADTDQVDVVRRLAATGFYVVDVNVTFGLETAGRRGLAAAVGAQDCAIREIRAQDYEAVLEIAATCFRYSRFHLDPLIPKGIANRVKCDWILSYIKKQRGEQLFVAVSEGRPAGFLAVLAQDLGERRVRVIDLIGVDEAFQGRGMGRALVSFFIDRYAGESDYLQVGTQVANLPSLSLYQKFCFTIARTQYVMHMHVRSTTGEDNAA